MRVHLPRLLLITDAVSPRRHGRGVIDTIARAFFGFSHCDEVAVVARAPDMNEDSAARFYRALRPICARAGVRLFAHSHAALTGALHLDGCHLPERLSPRVARLRAPRDVVIGASAHPGTPPPRDVDYMTWSPIFSPSSKVDSRAPVGVDALRAVVQHHRVPVYALGGVTDENASACLDAGAQGVAVSGFVCGAAHPQRALLSLLRALGVS